MDSPHFFISDIFWLLSGALVHESIAVLTLHRWAIIHQEPRLSFRRKKTRCCPTIPSMFPLIETVMFRRSGPRDGPSGNVSLDTICRVTRKTHSIVTRESLVEGWELRMKMLRSRKLRLAALSWIGCSKWVNLYRMRLDRIACKREKCPCFRFMQQSRYL